jgi:hypothetical protein
VPYDACIREGEFSQESDDRCLYCAKLDIVCSSHDEPRVRAPVFVFMRHSPVVLLGILN